MTAIPSLYLKWNAFRELAGLNDKDNWIGNQVFKTEYESGAQRFSKLLRGDVGCTPKVAESLTQFMNEAIAAARVRSSAGNKPGTRKAPPELQPADLELPALTFIARVVEQLYGATAETLDRTHRALVGDMTLDPPGGNAGPRLVVERYGADRSFGPDVQPSGGAGPMVFEVGKHKGQLVVIDVNAPPVAAYTLFTRDTAPIGKRMWDLSWGEAVMWLPSPTVPRLSDGRLLLLQKAEPVNPKPGRFIVTCALVWQKDAIGRLDPRGAAPAPGIMDEPETTRFLTNLRRMTEDKFKKWDGAVTVTRAEYLVKG